MRDFSSASAGCCRCAGMNSDAGCGQTYVYFLGKEGGMFKGPVTFLLYSTSEHSPTSTQQEHLQS